ncbi:hypothetical protein PanWU01x14_301340 [Parasponia andersonii]|uniref:Uncharacterized protein n=1 Tax=Parasponia andersonii TaxID=3476 RepID=A0A2P5ATP7_PARAD|nr:hypothetical protein PanWU01x14_301340 [Parasponia andersonii]
MWTRALVWRVSRLGHCSNLPFSLALWRSCPPVSPAKTTRRLRHLGGDLSHLVRSQWVGTRRRFCIEELRLRNTNLLMKGDTSRLDGDRPMESKLEI